MKQNGLRSCPKCESGKLHLGRNSTTVLGRLCEEIQYVKCIDCGAKYAKAIHASEGPFVIKKLWNEECERLEREKS